MTGICCIIFPKVFFCYLETFFTIQSLGVILCRKLWLIIIFWLMIWLVLLRKSSKKNIWNFPDLVGGWVWKSPFSRFKKIKNMLSKCIKMPKYSFKRNLFFAIWGGVSDWFWPTHHPTHLTCITVAAPRIVSAALSIVLAAPLCQPYRKFLIFFLTLP